MYYRMWEQLKRRSSYQALPLIEAKRSNELYREILHPLFQSVRVIPMENNRGILLNQTIITLTKMITPQALHQCLKFIYTGTIDKELTDWQVREKNNEYLCENFEFLQLFQLSIQFIIFIYMILLGCKKCSRFTGIDTTSSINISIRKCTIEQF